MNQTQLQLSFTNDNVGCFMGNTGAIDLTVTGGAAGSYNLSWSGPNSFTSSQEDLNDLIAGDYTILATDQNGCSISQTITITQPSTGVTTSISDPMTICFGATDGIATVTASGGTPPYNYQWNDPSNQSTPTASNLPPGIFTVVVTDQSGCTFTEDALIEEQPEISIILSQTSALCFDATDGTATIDNILYGNTPANMADFNIQWNTSPGQTSLSASNLQGGNIYEVTISNVLGCTAIASIEIGNPPAIEANVIEATDVVCFGGNEGTARAEGTGGTPPFTYLWSSNANSQQTALAVDLSIGNYSVTVSDANGCTTIATALIEEPEELEVDAFAITDVACFGESTGALVPDVRGGNAPYSYVWSNGETTESIDALLAGTYNLTVTDASGCTTESLELVQQPTSPLLATSDSEDVICNGGFDGQILLYPVGGTQPYMYSADGINFNGSPTQIGLYAGDYNNVSVMDGNGCVTLLPPVTIYEPVEVQVDLGNDTTIIYGQSMWLTPAVFNATGDLQYVWTPDDDEHLNCFTCETVYIDSLSNQISYQVAVTDENGCTSYDVITIFVKKFREVLVPTGFSPNQDGNKNDLLLVHGRPGTIIKTFRVYDRWGELVYENKDFDINNPAVGWDGKLKGEPMNPGVFVWYVEAQFEDGVVQTFKGQTTLLR